MILRTALCLAVTLPGCFAPAAPKPKPRPAAPPVLQPDPTVPAPGAAGERLPPGLGRSRAIGPMAQTRTDFQATCCPDGRVLVTGGTLTSTGSEWFDPASNRFSPGPALTRPRQGHRALLLKDGRLLLVGGTGTPAPAELLEPGGTAFKPLGEALFGLCAEAVELDDGRVCLVDGASGLLYTWDGRKAPVARTTLARPRNFFRALRLKDGRVAILGGWPSDQPVRGRRPATGPLPVELFNPRWSSLSSWTARPQPRARHQAMLLADGRICLWGGVAENPDQCVAQMEVLDPVKETVTPAASLELHGNPAPGWALDVAGQGLFLAEAGQGLLRCPDPLALAGANPAGRLANGYLAPTLVPLQDGGVLVLGSAAFGPPLDRWDPRSRQFSVLATLRLGSRGLVQLPGGQVLALGPVVDLLDTRTGLLKPLGWEEDLGALLATVKPPPAVPGAPPFAAGRERQDPLVVALDKTRALVVGGQADGQPSGEVELWDLKKKTLTSAAPMKLRRARPGGLRLSDGAVLVWGEGRE